MRAPPLPEAFGNYALGDFAEVVPPESVSWLPQTSGWALLGLIVMVLALRRGWQRLRRWHRNRYRREATARLQTLQKKHDGTLVTEINGLLKHAVLAHRPRREVAALTGEKWVDYLNSRCPIAVFRGSSARLLANGSYRLHNPAAADADALLSASLAWLQQHSNDDDV